MNKYKRIDILLVLLVFCLFFISACGPSEEEQAATAAAIKAEAATNTPFPSATPMPTSTPRPKPTKTLVIKSPTPDLLFYPDSTLECNHWSKVNQSSLGDEICIYGLVINVESGWSGSAYFAAEFSPSKEDFKLVDVNNYVWSIEPGDCILAKGEVRDYVAFIYLSPFKDGIPTDIYAMDEEFCDE